jgi:hypothetical protein
MIVVGRAAAGSRQQLATAAVLRLALSLLPTPLQQQCHQRRRRMNKSEPIDLPGPGKNAAKEGGEHRRGVLVGAVFLRNSTETHNRTQT